jgi:hypothetical protein
MGWFMKYRIASLVILLMFVGGGWYASRRWEAAREGQHAGELHWKLAVDLQPLTDDEFDIALRLCDGIDPETRFVALISATEDAIRYHPERKSRVVPIAVRLLKEERNLDVRAKAINALNAILYPLKDFREADSSN